MGHQREIDYDYAFIYQITCRDVQIKEKYIGITTNIRRRRCAHKTVCNNIKDKGYNTYVYKFIRANGGWDNWRLDHVTDVKYPKGRNDIKKKIEADYIKRLNGELNIATPGRTNKQYYDDNKEYYKEYYKQYSKDNKEKLKQYQKQYREDNKDQILLKRKQKITCICGSTVSKQHIKRHERTKKHIQYIESTK